MSAVLLASEPGFHVTVQDAGRRGWRRFGIPESGAMDPEALVFANTLVGNPPDDAVLEFAHVGGAWEVHADSCRIAVTGGDFALSIDGQKLTCHRSYTLGRGQRIMIGGTQDAVWGYLAVAGGFDLPLQLGGRATHLSSGIGGLHGRLLAAGDELPLRATIAPAGPERRYRPSSRPAGAFRVVPGPQNDFFTPEGIETFFSSSGYRVTQQGDRMGYRLAGDRIAQANRFNIISDGLVPGSIQVPGTGQPIVLLMDCQTIGGYPKIGTLITADLGRFAQCRPGTTVRFAEIDVASAQSLARAFRSRLDMTEQAMEAIATTPRHATRLRDGERP